MKLALAALAGAAYGYVSFPFTKLDGDELVKRDGDDSAYLDVDLLQEKNFYAVDVGIGSPQQNVTVLLDTGSSDFWVIGAENAYCKSNRGKKPKGSATALDPGINGFPTATNGIPYAAKTIQCEKYGTFNATNSSSFKNNNTDFLVTYGSGTYAEGYFGLDTVSIGGIKVENVSVGVSNFTNTSFGILGIGFPALESSQTLKSNISNTNSSLENKHPYMNFPQVLKERGVISKVAYSLFLNSSKSKSGSIMFGAVDHSLYEGDLYTLPIIRADRDYGSEKPFETVVTFDGISIGTDGNETAGVQQKIAALLDSGTSTTVLPFKLFTGLLESLGGESEDNYPGIKLPKCLKKKENPQITFQFSGVNITFDMKNIITKHKGKCYLDVVPGVSSSAIIGANVLRNMYTVFDLEDYQIAIAKATTTFNASDIEEITDEIPSAIQAPEYSATYTAQEVSGFQIPDSEDDNNTNSSVDSSTDSSSNSSRLARRAYDYSNMAISAKVSGSMMALAFALLVSLFL